MAEYEALLMGLKLAKAIEAEVLNIKNDSQLVMHQFAKIYEVKEPTLKKILCGSKKVVHKVP